MPANPPQSYLRLCALGVLTGVLAIGGSAAPALATPAAVPASMQVHMHMGGATPEHVAEALAALDRGSVDRAHVELRLATRSGAEPKDARMHAMEALAALSVGDRPRARSHAANGAAVEHLSYALRALDADQTTTARGHLGEAVALPRVHRYARAALAAITRGHLAHARHEIRAGLKAANRE